jgi:hypothetical protein
MFVGHHHPKWRETYEVEGMDEGEREREGDGRVCLRSGRDRRTKGMIFRKV